MLRAVLDTCVLYSQLLRDVLLRLAAIRASATRIVTHNVRDFPLDALTPYTIEAWTPDQFLIFLLQQNPEPVLAVLRYMSSFLRRPPLTPREIAEALFPLAPDFSRQAQALLN